ncbi:MAG: DUF4404 family protein [Pseudomonadota bacterium]
MERHKELLDLLETLRKTLAETELSEERANDLNRLLDAMEQQVPATASGGVQQDLLEDIQREATELEAEHPDFVATVRTLINMLSNLGL